MKRFEHIQWFEWIIYSLFMVYALAYLTIALNSLGNNYISSTWVPAYANTYLMIRVLAETIPALAAGTGVILLLFANRRGWHLCFFGSIALLLINFVFVRVQVSNGAYQSMIPILVMFSLTAILLTSRLRLFYSIKMRDIVLPLILAAFFLYVYQEALGLAMVILKYTA